MQDAAAADAAAVKEAARAMQTQLHTQLAARQQVLDAWEQRLQQEKGAAQQLAQRAGELEAAAATATAATAARTEQLDSTAAALRVAEAGAEVREVQAVARGAEAERALLDAEAQRAHAAALCDENRQLQARLQRCVRRWEEEEWSRQHAVRCPRNDIPS